MIYPKNNYSYSNEIYAAMSLSWLRAGLESLKSVLALKSILSLLLMPKLPSV